MTQLGEDGLDLLFRTARTYSSFAPRPVPAALLGEVYDLARLGPTSANCQPLRIVFVASAEAKARLAPALSAGNRDKTLAAPVTAIFAHDLTFYDLLPRLFPHNPSARSWFADDPAAARTTALRNGTLQAAYFMLAARAKGLACGPMSGFNAGKVEAAFFPDSPWRVNFLCNLGFPGDPPAHPRAPRLAFDEACRIA